MRKPIDELRQNIHGWLKLREQQIETEGQMREITDSIGDQALSESVYAFLDEGELPLFPDGEYASIPQFWAAILEMLGQIDARNADTERGAR